MAKDLSEGKRVEKALHGTELGQKPLPVRRPVVTTGNPRITVAFPFSKIELRDPEGELGDLAAMVSRLAEQVAALARQSETDLADPADQLAAEASALAHRILARS